MLRRIITAAAVAAVMPLAWACQSDGENGDAEAGASAVASDAGAPGSASALVSVKLQNVLNDLALTLNVDRASIPANAQVPIDVAANVCGVSVNILSVSTGGQAECMAKTASAELAQAVQQQIAAGGSTSASTDASGAAAASTDANPPATTTPPTQTTPQTPPN